jgi:spore coat polysaccharide biosynthesis predicted glycosyltransferase SpsG
MPYRCHLRCKAGLGYGWGHLVRAATLATYLRARPDTWRVTLAVEGEPEARAFLDGRGLTDAILSAPGDAAERRLLDANPPDLVIVDMLAPEPDVLARYRRGGCRVLAFSDTGIAHADADLVICPNPEEVWAGNRNARMIGGLDYVIVPDAVVAAGRSRGPEPVRARRLFINMGGGITEPVFARTAAVLERLAEIGFGGVFLLGYDRDFAIDEATRQRQRAFRLLDGTDRLADLFAASDLALTAAGYMRYDVAAAGLPAVLVSLVDHQHDFGVLFKAKGIAEYGGPILDGDPDALAARIAALADDAAARTRLSETGRRLVDGRALDRIAAAAENLLHGADKPAS